MFQIWTLAGFSGFVFHSVHLLYEPQFGFVLLDIWIRSVVWCAIQNITFLALRLLPSSGKKRGRMPSSGVWRRVDVVD
jgi:hypothetical protein